MSTLNRQKPTINIFTRTPNATTVPVTQRIPTTIYHYSPKYLLISYGIGLLFSLISAVFGLYAFYTNGVVHSTSLSAIIATTRNPDLDVLAEGHSLGALPLSEKMRNVKLRFGAMKGEMERVALGREENVVGLKKGGVYY
jgi:hypothetical protein